MGNREVSFWQRPLLVVICLLAFGATSISVAFGQGFMVKPMKLESSVGPGRTVTIPLEIRNTAGSEVRAIDVRLVGLSQERDGSWKVIEPDANTTADPYSAAPWTSFDQTHVEIEPLQPAVVQVKLSPPPNARGIYYAGVIAETPVPKTTDAVAVRIRFLIPLIVEIAGRPVRQHVAISDAQIALVDASQGGPSSVANLIIVNDGRTYSRVKGTLTLERKNGDAWRPVTRIEVPDRSILPGLTLALGGDMKRRLPSGTYRLRGELLVDGRRVAPLVKEINFVGDPGVDTLAYDTSLLLTPEAVTMRVVPGATRTTILSVENPGTDPVNISMSSRTPLSLGGVQMGDLLGVDLSAEPWTEIRPAQFTIRPGGRQNVRVISRIPDSGIQYPNYYADLVLEGVYANGQSAGTSHSTIHLANTSQTSSPNAVVEQLELEQGDAATQYVVRASIANIGNVDIQPSAQVYLLDSQGKQLRSATLSGDEQMLLPLGKRTYSAELDFGGLQPGYYVLRSSFKIADGKQATKQQIIRVDVNQEAGANGSTLLVPAVSVDDNAPDISLDTPTADGPLATPDGDQQDSQNAQ